MVIQQICIPLCKSIFIVRCNSERGQRSLYKDPVGFFVAHSAARITQISIYNKNPAIVTIINQKTFSCMRNIWQNEWRIFSPLPFQISANTETILRHIMTTAIDWMVESRLKRAINGRVDHAKIYGTSQPIRPEIFRLPTF